jgi:hypothetical protein
LTNVAKKQQQKLLPTTMNMAGKATSRVTAQYLYQAMFTTFACHNLPEDIDLPREIIKDASTTLSSLHTATTTPQSKLNLEVASWNTEHMPITSIFSLIFEDNIGEDGLSLQSTYQVNIDTLIKLLPFL